MDRGRRMELILLLLIHNLIYPYLYFTILFLVSGSIKNRLFVAAYFVVCSGVLVHWISNNNQCFLTEMQNDVMDVEGVGFRDMYNIMTNTHTETDPNSLRNKLYYAAIVTSIVYSACYLFLKQ